MSIVRARLPFLLLRGAGRRALLTVLAIAIAAAAVVATDLVNRGVARAFSDTIEATAGRTALRVWGDGAFFPARLAARIESIPGVQQAIPSVVTTAFADDDMLTIHGLELARPEVLRVYEPKAGEALAVDARRLVKERRPILLPRALASRRGLSVGAAITLETPAGREPFVVAGLIERGEMVRVLGEGVALMPLHVAQEVVSRAGSINRIDVVAAPDADLAALAEAISAVLPPGPRVITPAQRAMDFHRVTASLAVILWTVATLSLVLSFVIAFGSLAGEFESRAWEIGVLRSVGVGVRAVRRALLAESLVLGLIGVALGLPLGIAIGRIALPSIGTAAASAALAAAMPELEIRPASLVLGAAVALLAVALAAALPAHRAARIAIAETVRGRGIEQPGEIPKAAWLVFALAAAGATVAMLLARVSGAAAWGVAATALAAVAVSRAARPLLALAAGPLVGLLGAVGPAGLLTGTTALRRPRRAALVVSVAAVGLGCIVWLSTVASSFERSLDDTLAGTLAADLFVTSAHTTSGWIPAPLDDGVLDELRAIDGVADVAGNRVATWRFAEREIVINAFDPRYFEDQRFGRSRLLGAHRPDAFEAVARGEGAFVSTNFAHHFAVEPDDTIGLDAPAGRLALPVVGRTMAFMAPGGTIEMSRELYRRMWNDDRVNRIWLRVTPGAAPEVVRGLIASRLGTRYRLQVLSSGEMREHLVAHVRRAFAPIDVLLAIVLLVMLIGLADVLAAGVAQRTRELGMLRAVGVPRRAVALMVLIEGAVLGGLGLVLAAVLGLGLGMLWVTVILPELLGWTLEPHAPQARLVTLGALTLIVGFLAGWLPARRAAAHQPAAALRYD